MRATQTKKREKIVMKMNQTQRQKNLEKLAQKFVRKQKGIKKEKINFVGYMRLS